jgi:ribosomal protein S18 acetylase RimI-like enzyme
MVRRAGPGDAEAIARVHVATWRTTYRGLLPGDFLDSLSESHYADRWRRGIDDASTRVYVAEHDGVIAGFASCGRERAGEDGFRGELYALYVDGHAQGLGYGSELVRAAVDGLREMAIGDMIVWVHRENAAARSFYERLGGTYLRTQPVTIGSTLLLEASYAWHSLDDVRY